jgi:predicted GNAT family N-acyltransferase
MVRPASGDGDEMIEVRVAQSKAELDTCLRLRWTVFVEEQGVPPSLEVDDHDRDPRTVHALGFHDKVPAAAGRAVFLEGGVARIGRMAVVDDVRKRGLGAALLRFLENEAKHRGAKRATLAAQVRARGFYERNGYAARGTEFDDAGIPHVEMTKAL